MKRRDFLRGVGAATLLSVGGTSLFAGNSNSTELEDKDGLIRLFIEQTDRVVKRLLRLQDRRPDSARIGGFSDTYGLYTVQATTGALVRMVAVALNEASSYYRSADIEKRISDAIDFIVREQHEDGTIDLDITNFHSPPDTAFVVKALAPALKYVRTAAPNELPHFQEACSEFLGRAGRLLARGGIHTANHRWVVCSALARINDMMPDPRYVKRINQWLAEGIDIDSDGLYTEKSAIYSPTVNTSLITVARLLNLKGLYEPIRRNLKSTIYLFHANGEPVTNISIRQDRNQRIIPTYFYYPYRYMAQLDGDGSFSAMVRFIEKNLNREQLANAIMPFYWEDREKLSAMPPAASLPEKYEKVFPRAKIVRLREGKTDVSIIAEDSILFSMWKGGAVLQAVRMASAFFGKGQFKASELSEENGAYILTQRLTAAYYQPIPPEFVDENGDWRKMPKSRRKKTESQELIAKVSIRPAGGKYSLKFDVSGTDGVPVSIELAFRGDGRLSGVTPIDGTADSYFIGKDGGSYQAGEDEIHFSPGPSVHKLLHPRFTEPPMGSQRVYITGCAPFEYELTIS